MRTWSRLREKLRLPSQIALSLLLAIGLPFVVYVQLAALGLDITRVMYLAVVIAVLLTAFFVWMEGLLGLKGPDIPDDLAAPYPPASAIIAAYLPNEAAIVVETIEAFLRLEYPAPIQIILAYNAPKSMPIENVLQEIAVRDARFLPLRVDLSTSKAQNINAALEYVTGEFVGIFDADHQPEADSFTRAWCWFSHGYDVVQGHCLVRNGDASWVTRTVAVEFETIYALTYPGRARLHGFGLFGGSNGYWNTKLLRETRFHRFMLTEDIDASLRIVEQGYRIASDPHLLSRELAPVKLKALWNQRMRWAQGWFQVSIRHVRSAFRSPHLSSRQKLGLFHLLVWREIYPWLSIQIVPLVAFQIWNRGGASTFDWFVPIFLITSFFALSTGPWQTFFAYLVSAPEIRRHKFWYLAYLVVASVFYAEVKNTISRTAVIKEFMKERTWKITPRMAGLGDADAMAGVTPLTTLHPSPRHGADIRTVESHRG